MRLNLTALTLVAVTTLALPVAADERAIRNSIALGALVFADICEKCHQLDGYGEEALYPSLHDPRLLANNALLIQTILNGRLGHRQNDGATVRLMPALDFLSDEEITAVIAFISNSWGNDVLMVTEAEIELARSLTSD